MYGFGKYFNCTDGFVIPIGVIEKNGPNTDLSCIINPDSVFGIQLSFDIINFTSGGYDIKIENILK